MNKDTIISIFATVIAGGLILLAGSWLSEFIFDNLFTILTLGTGVVVGLFWLGLHEDESHKKTIK